ETRSRGRPSRRAVRAPCRGRARARGRRGRSARGRTAPASPPPSSQATRRFGGAPSEGHPPKGRWTAGAPDDNIHRCMAIAASRGAVTSLLGVLDRPGPLVILPHDNPDPDALASAAALKYLVGELLRKEAHIALGGIVGRAENRAMLTYLNITLVPVSEVHFGGETQVALVDTQPGRPNNSLPEALVPTAVIDHHPAYDAYPGVPFLDLRDQYGATSTILTEYLRESKLAIEPKIGTALFYGIAAETQDLGREATAADIEASHFLYPHANKRRL